MPESQEGENLGSKEAKEAGKLRMLESFGLESRKLQSQGKDFEVALNCICKFLVLFLK